MKIIQIDQNSNQPIEGSLQEFPESWKNISFGVNKQLVQAMINEGWRYYVTATHGEKYKTSTWADDGINWTETVTDYTDEEYAAILAQNETDRQAEELRKYQEKIQSFTPYIQKAVLLRMILRRYFGDNAETNREVTADTVGNYFMGKQVAGTLTVNELSDAIVLDKLFEVLKAWNMSHDGADDIWTLPWEIIP